MKLLEYYASLRKDLLKQIGWTKDAGSDWEHSRCNKNTQQHLQLMLLKYIREAKPFGVYLVTEYRDEPKYRGMTDGITIEDGKPVVQGDPNYVWGAQIYFGTYGIRHPYVSSDSESDNILMSLLSLEKYQENKDALIAERVIYKKDSPDCEVINAVLEDIARAVSQAAERQPRSGIREYILRAVLRLNDAILPFTVDEYLDRLKELASMPSPFDKASE